MRRPAVLHLVSHRPPRCCPRWAAFPPLCLARETAWARRQSGTRGFVAAAPAGSRSGAIGKQGTPSCTPPCRRDALPRLGNRRSRKHRTSARRLRWARRSAPARTGGRPPAVTRAPKRGRAARGPWDAASSRLLLHAVMQLNHTILEAIDGVQLQGHVTMTPRYQGDAVPNEDGDHTDDELVDRLRVKKRGDDLATPHQPDILTRLRSKAAHEWPDGIIHELHA